MDLEEWEFLPDNKSFLDFGHEGGKDSYSNESCFDPKWIVDMNYFICPPLTDHFVLEEKENSCLLAPTDLKPIAEKRQGDELTPEFKDTGVMPPVIIANHGVVSLFKAKENESIDMKMNSLKSNTRGIIPNIEPEPIQSNEEEEDYKVEEVEHKISKNSAFRKEVEKREDHVESEVKGKPLLESFGFNIWRWRLTGTGAICSIGVAAATFCAFILGGRQRQKQQDQNQRIQFQIYADDKATGLNQAPSAVRGAPMTKATHISFGGYYNGL